LRFTASELIASEEIGEPRKQSLQHVLAVVGRFGHRHEIVPVSQKEDIAAHAEESMSGEGIRGWSRSRRVSPLRCCVRVKDTRATDIWSDFAAPPGRLPLIARVQMNAGDSAKHKLPDTPPSQLHERCRGCGAAARQRLSWRT
jgi:hypothetical protein